MAQLLNYLKATVIEWNFNHPLYTQGGGQGQISWKHNFEITGDQNGLPNGLTF